MPSLEGDTIKSFCTSEIVTDILPQDRFDVPYTHCGCPLPGETIGQKLSRLVSSQHLTPSYLVPPPREDLYAATHPSDHNAVYAFHHGKLATLAQQRRLAKIKKRQARDAVLVQQGKLRSPTALRSCGYETPFLIPVPLYYGGVGFGGGCVGYAGSVVDGGPTGYGGCATVRFLVNVR